MGFLIPDNLRSRQDLAAPTRRVAAALGAGLDESVTVWFEPPFDTTGRRPHFVLLAPDEGVIVLEVLDARSTGLLGAFRGRLRIERDGRELEVEHPLARAEAFANHLKQRIAAERRLHGVAVPVGAGAVFPSLTRADADAKGVGRIASLERCLFREEIDLGANGQGETAIRRAFAYMRSDAPATFLDGDTMRVVSGLIHPDTIIDAIAGGHTPDDRQLLIFRPSEDETEVVRVMDRRQEQFAKSLGPGHRVIRGVAGSGKTLLLVYRARLLAGLHPGWRILVTCFSRTLAGYLRSLLHDTPNVEVQHFDGLLGEWLRAASTEHPGFADQERDLALEQGLAARASLPDATTYDAVLVDEAQDFSTERLRAVAGLVRPEGDLVIVADPAQRIFRWNFSWREAGIQAQGRTRVLRENYRNTREILDFANGFLFPEGIPDDLEDDEGVVSPADAHFDGPPPTVQVVRDLDAEVAAVLAIAETELREHRRVRGIGVLYATQFAGQANRAELLAARLAELDGVYWLSRDGKAKDDVGNASEPIVLSTLHSAKGLEFHTVILAGLTVKRGDEREQRAVYVGMTRATRRLHIVVQSIDPLRARLPAAVSP